MNKANHPLAEMTALNFHNYYIPKLMDAPDDVYLNNAWISFPNPFLMGSFYYIYRLRSVSLGYRQPMVQIVTGINLQFMQPTKYQIK